MSVSNKRALWLWASMVPIVALLVLVGCSKSSEPELNTQYKSFADAHWSDGPYYDSLKVHRDIDRWGDSDSTNGLAHHLPFTVNGIDTTANRNHEHYENIGKYDQFVWGWDDLHQVSTADSIPEHNFQSAANRATYLSMLP